MDPNFRPHTVDGIEINEVADGYVIYDPNQDRRAHYLNHTAGVILELCNGQVSAGEPPALVQAAYDLPEPPVDEVASCGRKAHRREAHPLTLERSIHVLACNFSVISDCEEFFDAFDGRTHHASYYNKVRPHRSLDKNAPDFRRPQRLGRIAAIHSLVACITNMSGFRF